MSKTLEINPAAKALIFDLDGTLADTMPVHFQAYKQVLAEYGIDLTPELFVSLAGIPVFQTIERLNGIFGTSMHPEKVGQYKEDVYEKMMHKIKPVEPVVALLKKYHGKMPVAVGTGGYKRLSWESLKIIGLDEYIEVLVSAEDVSRPKPYPDTFLRCAELLGVSPEDCEVFEDGEPGMQAARAAGMMATLVTPFYETSIGKTND